MTHLHPIYDTDPHFSINIDNREISHASSEKLILIQGDHNSEVYTFEIPRYIDGHDMMLCNQVQIHYINIDSNNSNNRSSDVYEVLDMQLAPDDENHCVFSWTISSRATAFVGSLTFAIRFACMNGTKLTYAWNTTIFKDVIVATSIDNANTVVAQNSDILESWYWEFVSVTTTGVNVIDSAKEVALGEIEAAKQDALGVFTEFDTSVTDSIDALTEVYNSVVPTVEVLETDNASNKERLTALEENAADLADTRITTLETDNTSNKERLDSLETDNEINTDRIVNLIPQVTNIESVLQVNETGESERLYNIENSVGTLESDNSYNQERLGALETDNESNKSGLNLMDERLTQQEETTSSLTKIELATTINLNKTTNTIYKGEIEIPRPDNTSLIGYMVVAMFDYTIQTPIPHVTDPAFIPNVENVTYYNTYKLCVIDGSINSGSAVTCYMSINATYYASKDHIVVQLAQIDTDKCTSPKAYVYGIYKNS